MTYCPHCRTSYTLRYTAQGWDYGCREPSCPHWRGPSPSAQSPADARAERRQLDQRIKKRKQLLSEDTIEEILTELSTLIYQGAI